MMEKPPKPHKTLISDEKLLALGILAYGSSTVCVRLAFAPIDRLKVLRQVQPFTLDESVKRSLKLSEDSLSTYAHTKLILREQSFRAFWRGTTPHILNIFQFTVVRSLFYNRLSMIFYSERSKEVSPAGWNLYWRQLGYFTCSSLISVSLCYPLDVAHTRMCCDLGYPSKNPSSRRFRSILQCCWFHVKKHGVGSIYKGFSLCVLSSSLFLSISIGLFNFIEGNFLQKFTANRRNIHVKTKEMQSSLALNEKMTVSSTASETSPPPPSTTPIGKMRHFLLASLPPWIACRLTRSLYPRQEVSEDAKLYEYISTSLKEAEQNPLPPPPEDYPNLTPQASPPSPTTHQCDSSSPPNTSAISPAPSTPSLPAPLCLKDEELPSSSPPPPSLLAYIFPFAFKKTTHSPPDSAHTAHTHTNLDISPVSKLVEASSIGSNQEEVSYYSRDDEDDEKREISQAFHKDRKEIGGVCKVEAEGVENEGLRAFAAFRDEEGIGLHQKQLYASYRNIFTGTSLIQSNFFNAFSYSKQDIPWSLIAGSLSGFIAQSITFPLDTLRRSYQYDGCSPWTDKAYRQKFTSWADCFNTLYKKHPGRLYRGYSLSLMKFIPESIFIAAIYTVVKATVSA